MNFVHLFTSVIVEFEDTSYIRDLCLLYVAVLGGSLGALVAGASNRARFHAATTNAVWCCAHSQAVDSGWKVR